MYVDQLRREANKTRINVSEAIHDLMVVKVIYYISKLIDDLF